MSELSEVLGSKNCIDIIKRFLYRSDVEKYQSEVVRESGLSYVTATRCLNLLVAQDLLKESWRGGLKMYVLNASSPVVRQMKVLLSVDALYNAVKGFAGHGFELYLFGSAARGENDHLSDIDVLIIGIADDRTVVEVVESIKNATGREVNPVVKDPLEYSQLAQTDRVLYENLQRDRISII